MGSVPPPKTLDWAHSIQRATKAVCSCVGQASTCAVLCEVEVPHMPPSSIIHPGGERPAVLLQPRWPHHCGTTTHGTAGNPEVVCVCVSVAVTEPSCAWQ